MDTITITQFLHPNGRRRMMDVELPDDICELAKDQLISMETAPHDPTRVILYSHRTCDHVENELCQIANNVPGDPQRVLCELIKKVAVYKPEPEDGF